MQRLSALEACAVMDTPRDPLFDQVVFTLAQLLRVPAVVFMMVGEDRIWPKALVGPAIQDSAWAQAVMRFVIETDEVVVVEDAATDSRFPRLASGDAPQYRFCVAAPLYGAGRQVVGCLCALDAKQRTLTERQLNSVRQLARQGSELLQLRVHGLDLGLAGSARLPNSSRAYEVQR